MKYGTEHANARHGHAKRRDGTKGSPTYSSWRAMIDRCTQPGHTKWSDYGGRGISVCERWRSFEKFLADMGERPTGTSLDRIDNARSYEPGNCRWASASQQTMNRACARLITHPDGRTLNLAEWSRITGIKGATIWMRLKLGWPVETALSAPVTPGQKRRHRHAA